MIAPRPAPSPALRRLLATPVLALALVVAGCAPPPPPERLVPEPGIDLRAGSVAIVALAPARPMGAPARALHDRGAERVEHEPRAVHGEFVPLGLEGSGLLGKAVMDAHRDDARAVAVADHTAEVERLWYAPVASALREAGYRVVGDGLVVRRADEFEPLGDPWARTVDMAPLELPEDGFWGVSVGARPPDLAPLAEELGADRLLVLDLLRVGGYRWFGPFAIPTTKPFSAVAATVALVEPGASEPLLFLYDEHVEYVDGAEGGEAKAEALARSVESSLDGALGPLRDRTLDALP